MIREDLKLSTTLLSLYDNINYYKRYKELSNKYRTNGFGLEKIEKKNVILIFNELGYSAVYKTKEHFFKVIEKKNETSFYFHVNLKYGLVELIFGVLRKIDKNGNKIGEQIGGVSSGVCKLIEINKREEIEGYIKKPVFKNYKELKEILKEALSLYEDLKTEFIKQYS